MNNPAVKSNMLMFQVTWSTPLNPNGEIHGYEIRLPERRISHNSGNTSDLNVTVTDLIPYTNYSITVLACSTGGGYVGGCTESLSTSATTLPTVPEGLQPLSVVAVSESFLAVSWQPPRRPNGPNIRLAILHRELYFDDPLHTGKLLFYVWPCEMYILYQLDDTF